MKKRLIVFCVIWVLIALIYIGLNGKTSEWKGFIIGIKHEEVLRNTTNYEMIDAEYIDKDVSILYPQLIIANDLKKQNRINELIEIEALNLLNFYEKLDNVTIQIDYKILWSDENVLSIQFDGYEFVKGAAYSNNLLYTINIDINQTSKLMLKDFINIDKRFVEKFRNSKIINAEGDHLKVAGLEYIKETYSIDDLLLYFTGADSSYSSSPYIFSYFTEDAMGISIEVPKAIGGHLEVELEYKNINDNLNMNYPIWENFSLTD